MLHIGISGPIAAGKSTLASKLQEMAETAGYFTQVIAFATGIREIVALEGVEYRKTKIAQMLYSWGYNAAVAQPAANMIDQYMTQYPSTPGVKNRRLLQSIGTEVGREFLGADTWIHRTQQLARRFDVLDYLITDDLRFDNEALAVDVHIHIDATENVECYWQRMKALDPAYTFSDHPSERGLTTRPLLIVPMCFTDSDVLMTYRTLDHIRRLRVWK